MNARRALQRTRAPDEVGAEQRAWEVVRSAYRERPAARVSRLRWRLALVPVLALVAGALALSPAGATIARWVKDTLGVPHATKALFSLPAPGRVLISGPAGTWIIAADGSARRLGSWPQASWSPHGIYVAAARGDQLAALNSHGAIQWTLARRGVADPRWYPPTGYRVAYLSGQSLRVVAGDGSGDHLLATGVTPVAPAWRPGHEYELAYETRAGRLVARNATTGHALWSARPGARPSELAWSADGRYLLAIGSARASLYAADGRMLANIAPRAAILDASMSPDGRRLAVLLGGSIDRVVVTKIATLSGPLKPVFSGAGLRELAWSPNGRWLLVTWPPADQWVFVRVAGKPRITAVSRIAEQFGARTSAGRGFPRLDGWCCQRWLVPR